MRLISDTTTRTLLRKRRSILMVSQTLSGGSGTNPGKLPTLPNILTSFMGSPRNLSKRAKPSSVSRPKKSPRPPAKPSSHRPSGTRLSKTISNNSSSCVSVTTTKVRQCSGQKLTTKIAIPPSATRQFIESVSRPTLTSATSGAYTPCTISPTASVIR